MTAKRVEKKIPWTLIWVFLIFTLLLLQIGYYINKSQNDETKSEINKQLASITNLKVAQINDWLSERKKDALNISDNYSFINDLKTWLVGRNKSVLANRINQWINDLMLDSNYVTLHVVDEKQNVLFKSLNAEPLGRYAIKMVGEAVKTKVNFFSDLHTAATYKEVHFDSIIPLIDTETGGKELVAIILIRINPYKYFFPLLKKWPVPSNTAETYLVKEMGDSVLFIRNYRGKGITSLFEKFTVRDSLRPSYQAINGKKGLTQGIDYRGMNVIANIDTISGTDWKLIAKVDIDEVYSPIREKTIWLYFVAGLLSVITGVVTYLVWKNQQASFYKKQYSMQLERQALIKHFEYLVKYANDIILLFDFHGKIVEANDKALSVYGYKKEEILNLSIHNVHQEDERRSTLSFMQIVSDSDGMIFESVHKKKDGQSFPVEISSRVIDIEGTKYIQSIIRDITEKKEALEKIYHLNRMYLFLSQVNQSIVRVHTREELYKEICRIAIEFGKLDAAWIGLVDHKERKIKPYMFVSLDKSNFEKHEIYFGELTEHLCISSFAARENRIVICEDIAAHTEYSHSMLYEIDKGFRSAASIPIIMQGNVEAVLTFLSKTKVLLQNDQYNLMAEIGMDVSFALENMKKDTELKASEEKYRQLFNKMRDGFALFEVISDDTGKPIDYRFAEVNEVIERMTGLQREQIIGRSIHEIFPTITFPGSNFFDNDFAKNELYHTENYSERLDKYFDTVSYKTDDGKIAIISRDITEDKKRSENIRQLSSAVEQSPVCIVITDIEGSIQYINSSFCRVTGYSQEELLGKNPRVLKSGELSPERYKELWDTIKSGNEWRGEFHNKKKNGELYWELASIYPLKNERGEITHFIGIKEDITQLKETQSELILAKEKAEQLDKMKSEFLAQISHEIRSPINVIMSYINLLKDDCKPFLEPELFDSFGSIDRASTRIIRTIDMILNMSELHTGSYDLLPRRFNLVHDVLEHLIVQFVQTAKNKNLILRLESNVTCPYVYADEYSVTQIFVNLIDNAIKYTKEGRIEITVANLVPGKLQVIVADTGIGIAEEYMPELFNAFSQEEHGYTRKYEGNGLGLALVKKYCEINNAVISVESMKGKGTSFKVMFNLVS